jgi:hypothetical protein
MLHTDLESLSRSFMSFYIIFIFLIIVRQNIRVNIRNLPRQLDSDLLSLGRNFICLLQLNRGRRRLHRAIEHTCTFWSFFHAIWLNTWAYISSRVFRMLTHVFPRQIRSQAVHLGTVVSNEKDEIFSSEEAKSTFACQCSSLHNLWSKA